jgi:hypothetical protein
MVKNVFAKRYDVTPSQLAAAADRRFRDAEALYKTGQNERANGVVYLCGITVEILLKAQLMKLYPATARKRSRESMGRQKERIWSLIWRSHDLDEMLDQNPELSAAIKAKGERNQKPYLDWLKAIRGAWTIYVRYSPFTTKIGDAKDMLDRVRELKEVLK